VSFLNTKEKAKRGNIWSAIFSNLVTEYPSFQLVYVNSFVFEASFMSFLTVLFRHSSGRPPLAYNRLDDEYHVNRASHMGPYRVVDGLPL